MDEDGNQQQLGETFCKFEPETNILEINENLLHDDKQEVLNSKKSNEVALRLLGRPGKYAIVICIIGFGLNAFVAFNHVTLPSLYAVPVSYRCLSYDGEYNSSNAPVLTSNSSITTVHDKSFQCFHVIKGNDSKNGRTFSCGQWEYIYPHGFLNTWVNQWNLICDKKYMVSLGQSLYMTGVMIGSPITGMASDRFGRRSLLLFCLIFSSFSSIILPFINNIFAAVAVRFITGFFISGVHSIIYVAPTEMSPKSIVPILSVVIMNSFIIGVFIGNFIIFFIRDWITAQWILCVPSILLFIIVYFMHYESPSWALVRRDKEKYLNFFKNAMVFNKLNEAACSEIQNILDHIDFKASCDKKDSKTYTMLDLFKTAKVRKRSIIGIYLWFICGMSYYTLSYNIPNLSSNPFLALLVGSATDMPGFLLAFLYIPRIGKRKSLMAALLIGGLFCLIFKFVPHLAILLTGKMFLALSFGIVFIYIPEVFPAVIRNIGVGTLSLFSRIGGLVAPQVVLMGTYTDVYVPVFIVGCSSIIGAVLAVFAPETKDKDPPYFIDDLQ